MSSHRRTCVGRSLAVFLVAVSAWLGGARQGHAQADAKPEPPSPEEIARQRIVEVRHMVAAAERLLKDSDFDGCLEKLREARAAAVIADDAAQRRVADIDRFIEKVEALRRFAPDDLAAYEAMRDTAALSAFLSLQGDLRGAVSLLKQAIGEQERLFGHDGPFRWQWPLRLARYHFRMGDYMTGDRLLRELREAAEDTPAEEDPDFGTVQVMHGMLLGEYEPGCKRSEALLRRGMKHLGTTSPESINCMVAGDELAKICRRTGRLDEAEAWSEKALEHTLHWDRENRIV